MSNLPIPQCPTAETLALFANGDLDDQTRNDVLAHIEHCNDCMAAVLSANAYLEEERERQEPKENVFREANEKIHTSPRWWMAVAAAIVIAIIAVPFLRQRDPIERLAALAPRSERGTEARLSGGFAWAPYRGPMRSTDAAVNAAALKLGGVAGDVIDRAGRDRSAEAQHAAGVAMVLVEKPEEAVARLEDAAKTSHDAKTFSDLAAARYAAAVQLGRASLYPTALAAADAALHIDPHLPEALFNRALILEHLGLTDEAKRAWQNYLQADPSSPWATEARSHIAAIPASTHSSQFEKDRPLLERAAERGDTVAVRRYVDAHREYARRYAERECLARWAESLPHNDSAEAVRWLSLARRIGDALFEVSGEAMLRDDVRAIDAAAPAGKQAIANAHILFRNGRVASNLGRRADAEHDLQRSADAFETAHDPMALLARHFAISARLVAMNDTATARAALESELAMANTHPEYISFGGYVRWELGRALGADGDWSASAATFAEGVAMFHRGGEQASEGFMETNLAFALTALGHNDDAWLARTRAFSALSAEGDDPQRLATSIALAANAELAVGHREAALALVTAEAAIVPDAARPQLSINGLITRVLIQSMNGDQAGASQTVRRAVVLAEAATDEQLRANWTAKVGIAAGAVLVERNPRAAAALLTRSIDFYAAHAMPGALLDPLLLRSRCAVRVGDAPSAMRDLERGISIVESYPTGLPDTAAGWGVLDAQHALFSDAIRLSLERGDKAAAFAFAERSHGAPTTIAALQHRLAGTGTAVLEIVVLPEELITFAVASNDAVVVRLPANPETLAALADESLSESGTIAAARLYEELIRPAEGLVNHARGVVIVPDPRLATVPFAALYDSAHGRYLIERLTVSVASSAGSLQPGETRTAAPMIAAVTLPSGGTESRELPEAGSEVNEVASLYARAMAIPSAAATFAQFRTTAAGADIIHIAGHTERQQGGGEQGLLFASASGKLERVTWKTVVASPVPNRGVVVLAACETLRPPPSTATHTLSLGAAFSAAGAIDVVGTLTPVGDRDARLLFRALHRQLASGVGPAEALRITQQDAIAYEKTNGGHRSWRAIELLTRHIAMPAARKELSSWGS